MRPHRLVRRSSLLFMSVVVFTLAFGLTAYGADKSKGAHTAAAKPIKIMIISSFDNPIIDVPAFANGAKAATAAINKAGGVNGRRIQLISCNDKVDPNAAVKCARKGVSENVAGVVPMSLFPAQIIPIFQKAKIPTIGSWATEPIEVQGALTYPIVASTVLGNGALPGVLKSLGKKRIAGVVTGRASNVTDIAVMKKGAKASGASFVGSVGVPETTTDFAPSVQRIKNLKADASIFLLSRTPSVQLVKTGSELGLKTTWASTGYSFFPSMLSELRGAGDGRVVQLNPLPPSSAGAIYPGVRQFNKEVAAVGGKGDDLALVSMHTWLAIHAIAMVAKDVKGDVTKTTLVKQLDKHKKYNLMGLIDWTPAKKGPGIYKRLSNGKLWLSVAKGNDFVLKSRKPFDGFKLAGEK